MIARRPRDITDPTIALRLPGPGFRNLGARPGFPRSTPWGTLGRVDSDAAGADRAHDHPA